MISDANGGRGKILIEVPDFEWIKKKQAFWDIYYEHCNYFTPQTLAALFRRSDSWCLFDGQYQGLIADLADLRQTVHRDHRPKRGYKFPDTRPTYAHQLPDEGLVFVRGASSKGVTFLNHMDPERQRVEALIDINPKKQGRFIPTTGQQIRPPDYLDEISDTAMTILVVNPNYLAEIKERTQNLDARFVCL